MNVKLQKARFIDYKKIVFGIAINLGLLLAYLLMFHPAEKTDDYVMKIILDGATGYGVSAHLLYVNFILGALLKILQSIIPTIAWLEIISYVVVFCSFVAITYVVLDFNNIKRSILILFPILSFWGIEGYIKLTFSKVAGIAVGCGMFLLLLGLKNKNIKKSNFIIGLLFMIIGCMFRNKVLYSVFPIIGGIALIEIIISIRNKKEIIRTIIKYVSSLLIIYFILLLVYRGGLYLFNNNTLWREYKEYNSAKVELQDYGWPDYYENQAEYEQLGISYNDYRLWSKRDCSDPDIYTTKLVESIGKIKEEQGIKKYFINLTDFLKEYPISFIQLNVFFGAVILIVLLCFTKQQLKWLIIAYPLVVIILMEYYLYCNGRYGMHHIDVSMWFAVALFIIYFIYRKTFDKHIYSLIGVTSAVIILFSIHNDRDYLISETYDGSTFSISQKNAREVMDVMTDHKENIYVLSNNEYYGLMRAYDTFESVPVGKLDNIFILSSYAYPSHRVILEKYGINNIYDSLCNENVLYATSHGEGNVRIICTYIQEHYNENAAFKLINTINGVNFYKFYNEE